MEALQKLEQKRNLEVAEGYLLSYDSLTGEVINPEFQAIEWGRVYERLRAEQVTPQEQELLSQLRSGQRVRIGGF